MDENTELVISEKTIEVLTNIQSNQDTDVAEVNVYKPSPAEERLLQVLLSPENIGKNITVKCQLANISRNYYYQLMEKPEFQRLCRKTAIDLIKSEILPLIQKGIQEAKRGSFQHWKILMEMSGMYTEKTELENKVTMGFETSLLDIIRRRNQE